MPKPLNVKELKSKLEHFCAYQERCHEEVIAKLKALHADIDEVDTVVVHLIEHHFLNEERFARSFARGKHRIKQWGKIRIVSELRFRNISQFNISAGLSEITAEVYTATLHTLAERIWNNIHEINTLKKNKTFCDYLLRKGYEKNLVYEMLNSMPSKK